MELAFSAVTVEVYYFPTRHYAVVIQKMRCVSAHQTGAAHSDL
jgi:hypothetical protein